MLMVANLIATVAVLFLGIHPTVNSPDSSWISGLYDDADADTLLSVGEAKHIPKADLPLKVQGAAQILVCIAELELANLSPPAANRFSAGVRGPPRGHQKDLAEIVPPAPDICEANNACSRLPRTCTHAAERPRRVSLVLNALVAFVAEHRRWLSGIETALGGAERLQKVLADVILGKTGRKG